VVTLALLVSWIAAVVFVPYLGDKLLPDLSQECHRKNGKHGTAHDPYHTASTSASAPWWNGACVSQDRDRATVALFVGRGVLFRFVPQQFFPSSTRLELMVDLKLAEGRRWPRPRRRPRKLEAMLAKKRGIVENYVAYVGTGSPRFYLPLDQQLPQASFAQFVLLTTDMEAREKCAVG
jgi:multidrug efflux pump